MVARQSAVHWSIWVWVASRWAASMVYTGW